MKLDSLALPDLRGWARGWGRVEGVWLGELRDDEGGEGRVGRMKPPGRGAGSAVMVGGALGCGGGGEGFLRCAGGGCGRLLMMLDKRSGYLGIYATIYQV